MTSCNKLITMGFFKSFIYSSRESNGTNPNNTLQEQWRCKNGNLFLPSLPQWDLCLVHLTVISFPSSSLSTIAEQRQLLGIATQERAFRVMSIVISIPPFYNKSRALPQGLVMSLRADQPMRLLLQQRGTRTVPINFIQKCTDDSRGGDPTISSFTTQFKLASHSQWILQPSLGSWLPQLYSVRMAGQQNSYYHFESMTLCPKL